MQRINFLYQSSVYLAQLSGSTPASTEDSIGPSDAGKDVTAATSHSLTGEGRQSFLGLSRQHTRTMKAIGNKAVLRMDPSLKRAICKGCQTVLIPGVTAKVRTKVIKGSGRITRYICTQCQTGRNFPSPPMIQPPSSGVNRSRLSVSVEAAEPAPTNRKTREKQKAKLPPLFERDVGHVVFVGNEKTPRT